MKPANKFDFSSLKSSLDFVVLIIGFLLTFIAWSYTNNLVYSQILHLNDRELPIVTQQSHLTEFEKTLPLVVLLSGSLMTLLLFGMMYALSSSQSRANEIATVMTAKLRESEERFKVYMDNTSIVAWLKDPETWKYVYINKLFADTFRVSAREVTGKTDFDLFPENVAVLLRENDERILQSGSAVQVYEKVPTPDGSTHTWLVFKFPLRLPNNRLLMGGSAIDVTNERSAQEALQFERDRADAIISSMGEGLMVVDRNKRILLMNPVAQKLLEVSDVKTIIGQNWSEVVTTMKGGKEVPYAERSFSQALAQGKQVITNIEDNHYYKTKSGKMFPIASITAPLITDGTIVGAVKVFRDVTEDQEQKIMIEDAVKVRTRELREEEAKLHASIESLSIGFILTDVVGNIVQINSAAKRIICLAQYTKERGVIPLSPEVMEDCTVEKIQQALSGVVDFAKTVQKTITEKKPQEYKDITLGARSLHLFFSPVVATDENFRVLGSVVIVQDETEEKVLERSKDEFFSIASHELRTPLTAIRGNAAMIRDYYLDKIPDKDAKEMVLDIHESSTRLIGIVNDFLDLSRLEQGRMKFTMVSFDIVPVIEECMKELEGSFIQKRLSLTFEKPKQQPPNVFADKERVKEVMVNLMGNALKFTDTGGVTINLEQPDSLLKVSISDTGRGIPLENQTLLFRKFQQAGSSLFTRDTTRGTGLGLYISKMIISGMGGVIRLDKSEVDKGSTFSFTLPIAK